MAVYDISKPAEPRQIGFMPVEGGGIHRIWYVGGRWAYASALLDGFTDYIFITIDMADPTKPREAGRYWLPGMNLAAGETPNWPAEPPLRPAPCDRRTATSPIARGATPASSSSTSPTAPTRSSSRTRTGRRPSAAARTTACRCPTATC